MWNNIYNGLDSWKAMEAAQAYPVPHAAKIDYAINGMQHGMNIDNG